MEDNHLRIKRTLFFALLLYPENCEIYIMEHYHIIIFFLNCLKGIIRY